MIKTKNHATKHNFAIGIGYKRDYSNSAFCIGCEPKPGKWEANINGTDEWICSECGYVAETKLYKGIKPNYCPNCGIKMEYKSIKEERYDNSRNHS